MASKPAAPAPPAPTQPQQAVVLEVAASSSPVEVISAIVNSAATSQRVSNPNRWLQIGVSSIAGLQDQVEPLAEGARSRRLWEGDSAYFRLRSRLQFFFVLIFACVVYFREEIYTFTTGMLVARPKRAI